MNKRQMIKEERERELARAQAEQGRIMSEACRLAHKHAERKRRKTR